MSGGGSSGTQSSTTVQKSEPWSSQKPYLERGMALAEAAYNQDGPQYYPNSTVVPFAPQTEYALQAGENRALMGSPLNFGAQNLAMNTLNGGFLQGNPYFDNVAQSVGNQVRQQVDSAYAGANRGPSAGYAESLSRGIGDAISPYAFSNYEAERGRQMDTMRMAPSMAMSDYNDMAMLQQVGAAREGQAQRALGDDISRYNYSQQLGPAMLDQYLGRIQGNYGGTSTQMAQTPYYSNGLMTGLGALGTVAGIGGTMFGGGGMFPGLLGSVFNL